MPLQYQCVIEERDIPEDWNLALISSNYNRKEWGNYEGKSIMSPIRGLYDRIQKKVKA